jgi:hypothetical protein
VLGEVIWKVGARIFKRLEEANFRPPQYSTPLEEPQLDKTLATVV